MPATSRPRKGRRPGERYFALVQEFPLVPITDEADLDAAIAMIDRLSDRRPLGDDERKYMLVLARLIEDYEAVHYPMGKTSGRSMLAHLIEARETTQTKVAEGTGLSVSTVSEILQGKRKLNT